MRDWPTVASCLAEADAARFVPVAATATDAPESGAEEQT